MSVLVVNTVSDPVNVNVVSGGGGGSSSVLVTNSLTNPTQDIPVEVHGTPTVNATVTNTPAVTLSGSANAVNATIVNTPAVTLSGSANAVNATIVNTVSDPVNVNVVSGGGGGSSSVLVTNSLTIPAQDIPVEVHGTPTVNATVTNTPAVTLSGSANAVNATIVSPAPVVQGIGFSHFSTFSLQTSEASSMYPTVTSSALQWTGGSAVFAAGTYLVRQTIAFYDGINVGSVVATVCTHQTAYTLSNQSGGSASFANYQSCVQISNLTTAATPVAIAWYATNLAALSQDRSESYIILSSPVQLDVVVIATCSSTPSTPTALYTVSLLRVA